MTLTHSCRFLAFLLCFYVRGISSKSIAEHGPLGECGWGDRCDWEWWLWRLRGDSKFQIALDAFLCRINLHYFACVRFPFQFTLKTMAWRASFIEISITKENVGYLSGWRYGRYEMHCLLVSFFDAKVDIYQKISFSALQYWHIKIACCNLSISNKDTKQIAMTSE